MKINEEKLKDILDVMTDITEERKSDVLTNLDNLAREQAKSVQERRETIRKIRQEKYHK